MTSADLSLPCSAFATADAGFEYLATAEHYQYLARSIFDALRQHSLVVLTGEPPASPSMLATALREAAAPRPVIELCCRSDLDCEKLFAGSSVRPDAPASDAVEEEPGAPVPSFPIFLLADADKLSDDQIEKLQAIPRGPHGCVACVLLAHSDFMSRAESAECHLLDDGLTVHLRVQQLERDEIEAFIRHQLPSGENASLLTAQQVTLIAITSGGDPAVVNRLARRMLEVEPDVSALPRVTRRRSRTFVRLLAGIMICLGVVWFTAGTLEPQRLDVLVGLVRDRILPRIEHAAAPAGVAAVPSPEAAGSSSVNVASAPPTAASARETTPAADGPQISAAEIAGLIARGDAFLAARDIASARLFFERAADSGDGRAAMRMAVTYDAAFLDRAGLHGQRGGDPERAAFWYRRARELGAGKAEPPLGSLETELTPQPH
jgi:hypothetical protein